MNSLQRAARSSAVNQLWNVKISNSYGNNGRLFLSARSLSSFNGGSMMGGGPGIATPWNWPVRANNTFINIVPQGYRYVVERFGRMHKIQDSGLFLAIPLVDTISYVIDIRERALDIPPQSAITRDNVSVEVSGDLFVCFVDPEKAAYGALNPLYSVSQHAQSAMRSAIGEMELVCTLKHEQ